MTTEIQIQILTKLRAEAATAGDRRQVALCDAALDDPQGDHADLLPDGGSVVKAALSGALDSIHLDDEDTARYEAEPEYAAEVVERAQERADALGRRVTIECDGYTAEQVHPSDDR